MMNDFSDQLDVVASYAPVRSPSIGALPLRRCDEDLGLRNGVTVSQRPLWEVRIRPELTHLYLEVLSGGGADEDRGDPVRSYYQAVQNRVEA